eukprot:GHVU01017842.1.p1 GENE.GHVU01017842.1~~GHVU01017842.1.p1  ORF type:complete len:124 (-),score=15.21 GHVU01017842.1:667-1038(-)
MSEQAQPTKRKREEWPESVSRDADIHELDPAGNWVSCEKCFRKNKRVVIGCRTPFNLTRWEEHKDCQSHQRVPADYGSVAIMKQFVIVGSSRAASSSTTSAVPVKTPQQEEPTHVAATANGGD